MAQIDEIYRPHPPRVARVRATLPRRYSGLRRMGRQGRSAVYKALDTSSGLEVAIKLGSADPAQLEDLQREFRLLERLGHPGVVRALELGWSSEGLPYLVTEHAGARTLLEVGRGGSERALIRCVRQVVFGLEAIHRLGFVHGDLKPSHVLVREGRHARAVLVDLGLARRFGPAREITGTHGFLPPEMLRFEAVDARSDWFSLGMSLLHCLVEPLPRALRDTELAVRSRSRWRDAVQRVLPSLPAALRRLVPALLEPAAELRPQSPDDLLRLLGRRRRTEERRQMAAARAPARVGRRGRRQCLMNLLAEIRPGCARWVQLRARAGTPEERLLEDLCVEASLQGAVVLRIGARSGRLDMAALLAQLAGCLPGAAPPEAPEPPPRACSPLYRDVGALRQALARLQQVWNRPLVLAVEGPPEPEPALIEAIAGLCGVQAEAARLAGAMGRRTGGAPVLILSDAALPQSRRGARRPSVEIGFGIGRPARAAGPLEQALLDAVQAGDAQAEVQERGRLARHLLDRAELQTARSLLEIAPGPLAGLGMLQAELLLLEGRPSEALAFLRPLLAQAKAEGGAGQRIEARLLLGRTCEALGQPEMAADAFEAAGEEALSFGSEELLARCLRHLVAHATHQGTGDSQMERAGLWAEQLAARLPRIADPLERARTQFALARWLWRRHCPAKARLYARKAMTSFIRLGARLDKLACRAFLSSPEPPCRSRRQRKAASSV